MRTTLVPSYAQPSMHKQVIARTRNATYRQMDRQTDKVHSLPSHGGGFKKIKLDLIKGLDFSLSLYQAN